MNSFLGELIIVTGDVLPYLLVVLALIAFLHLGSTKNKRYRHIVWMYVLVLVITIGFGVFVKDIFAIPRPHEVDPLVPWDYGFPSLHTMIITSVAFLTSYLARYRWVVLGSSVVAVFLVGYARVLADVHSVLDIVGGLLFGLSIAVVVAVVYRWFVGPISFDH